MTSKPLPPLLRNHLQPGITIHHAVENLSSDSHVLLSPTIPNNSAYSPSVPKSLYKILAEFLPAGVAVREHL